MNKCTILNSVHLIEFICVLIVIAGNLGFLPTIDGLICSIDEQV